MKFKKLRKILSYTDVVQILKEDGGCETYKNREHIPSKFDCCKVLGVGSIGGPFFDESDDKLIGSHGVEIYLKTSESGKKGGN